MSHRKNATTNRLPAINAQEIAAKHIAADPRLKNAATGKDLSNAPTETFPIAGQSVLSDLILALRELEFTAFDAAENGIPPSLVTLRANLHHKCALARSALAKATRC